MINPEFESALLLDLGHLLSLNFVLFISRVGTLTISISEFSWFRMIQRQRCKVTDVVSSVYLSRHLSLCLGSVYLVFITGILPSAQVNCENPERLQKGQVLPYTCPINSYHSSASQPLDGAVFLEDRWTFRNPVFLRYNYNLRLGKSDWS